MQATESSQTIVRTSTQDNITIAVKTISKQSPPQAIKGPNSKTAESKHLLMQKGLFRIYRSNLLKKTYQHVIYPDSAIDKNQQGNVILKVVIDRSGALQSVNFHSRANFNSLNKAAKRAVNNAKPYPSAPAKLEGEIFEILMPIRFRLSD